MVSKNVRPNPATIRLSVPDKPDRKTLLEESDANNLNFVNGEWFNDSVLNAAVDAFDEYYDDDE